MRPQRPSLHWALLQLWPLLVLLPCFRAQGLVGDCTPASSSSACKCSTFSENNPGASKTDGKAKCETAGVGKGCKWEPGTMFGGICRGTCVGVEGACPTAAQCANYGTWNNVLAINGGKALCEAARCQWMPGKITGGSCVTTGSCVFGEKAEEARMGTFKQATIVTCLIAIVMAAVGLFMIRRWHKAQLKKKEYEDELKMREDEEINASLGCEVAAAAAAADADAAFEDGLESFRSPRGEENRDMDFDNTEQFDPHQLPDITTPFKWVKDIGFAEKYGDNAGKKEEEDKNKNKTSGSKNPGTEEKEGSKESEEKEENAQGQKAKEDAPNEVSKGDHIKRFLKRTGKSLGFDQMLFNVFRDWTQVMSLTLGKIGPQVPAFTSGFLVVFAMFTLDFQALAKVFNIDLQGFSVGVFTIAFGLFVVFQYFWWTDKAVDKLAEGDDVVSYAKQSKGMIRLKLYTIKACHFLFLMVCNNVFQEIWNYYFSPNFDRGRTFLAVVLLLGFVICVPIATFRLISVNKPRGSTEDPDYTFDLEGHKIKFTQEIYEQRMIRMSDINDKEYNPWVDLFKGYSRTWAEYPVAVMGIIYVSSPYLNQQVTDMDIVSKLSQLFTLVFGLGAIMACQAPDHTCSERCYVDGDGYGLGITVNVILGFVLVFQAVTIITNMEWYKARQRNKAGEFQFTEYDPATRSERRVSSLVASLIYDTHREKKLRVWYPFWDGIFSEFAASNDQEKKALGQRFADIKEQAMDAGVHRVMTWLEQEDADILEARKAVLESMEGIDVYCDESCYTVKENGDCIELLDTALGGDKLLSSETNFAKMYINAFPLRIFIVYDDCTDIGLFYDEALPKIAARQAEPEIADKVLLRKQLRCCHKETVIFPIERLEKRTVTRTYKNDKGDTQKEQKKVDVLITYIRGTLTIEQKKGGNTMQTLGSTFDLSQGFNVTLAYTESWGQTEEYDGGTWKDESLLLANAQIGIAKDFKRGTKCEAHSAGEFKRAGALGLKWNIYDSKPTMSRFPFENSELEDALDMQRTNKDRGVGEDIELTEETWAKLGIPFFHKTDFVKKGEYYFQPADEDGTRTPNIDDFIKDNKSLIEANMQGLLDMHQAYRVAQQQKRDAAEQLLTCRFWPEVYNKPKLNREQVESWILDNTRPEVKHIFLGLNEALNYCFSRMSFVKTSPQHAYWFTFWDDFWTLNFKMKCLEDKDDTFGSLKPTCILYNRMTRLQLEHVLTKNNLRGSRFQRPYLFFDELLDKLYFEMERASDKTLGAGMKKQLLDAHWQVQYSAPKGETFAACAPLLTLGRNKVTPHPEKPITETNLSGLGPGCMPTPADSRAELPEKPTPMHSRAEMPVTDFEDNPTNISGWGSKDTGPFTLPEIDPTFDQWLKGQLEASPDDPKDTDEFKYITFTELPPFTDQHKSLMRKTLTPEMFAKLKDVKSSKGFSLSNGIQAGVLRPHLGVGFTMGDEECFELFKDLINPIVKGWHQFDPATQTHQSDLNYDSLVFTAEDVALFQKYVKSTRIRAARNISGFSLPAGSSKEDRLAVEEVLKTAFSNLPDNLKGTYFPLGGLTAAQEDELQAGGFLFQKPGPMQLLGAAGAGRDWPSGRGIFHNPAKTVLCWCNEEDQCRIIAMEDGGDVKGVFTRFCQLSNAIKAAAEGTGKKLMEHPNYGFLGTCPSNLGTGLRGSVMIVLPELNKDPHKLEEICASFDLQPRGSAGEHSAAVGGKWDVSNKQRIGFTEVQLVQKMIDGVKKLIALEEKLAAGGSGGGGKDQGSFKLPEIDSGFDTWLKGQLETSPNDPKDTQDFKYITFTELPPFTDQHKSLMRKTLTPEMFAKLKGVKSSKGFSLSNGIQAGVLRPHLGVGFTMGDEECFELFKDLINPIVKGWHQFDPATQTHQSDLNYDSLVFTAEDVALFQKYVKSTRIRAARNISGFSLPAGSSKEDRLAVEEVLKTAFSNLPDNLKGTYFPLGGLTAAQEDELQAGGFLFQKPGPMQLLGAAGAGRDWPSGRGIFHNPAKTVLCWCNEEDQCRIIAMEDGGDVKGVFTRFCQLSNAIKAAAEGTGKKLMEHPNYGFLGTCPSNLGTGLRGSVMIVLPELNKDPHKLEEICASFDLQPRGSAGEHSAAVGGKWDVSNKQRIGFTEVQLVQKMIDGVKKLIALEEELAVDLLMEEEMVAAAGGD